MNCFFVSCEIAENPDLSGKPVVVAPNSSRRKSIVLTASYEARKYGVRSAMRLSDAERLCPNLIAVDSNMETYVKYSRYFFNYLYSITPLVEPGSIDEAFIDVTEICHGADALDLAAKIQNDLLQKYKLPSSIGIGPNKFLAKMASDMKKPLGITVLRKRDIEKQLWPLPINNMIGVGKKTLELLNMIMIKTIGDLATFKDIKMLNEMVGETNAANLLKHARGEGSNVIEPEKHNDVSSVSNSHTFDNDEYNTSIVKETLKVLTNTVSNKIKKRGYAASTVILQVKYSNFQTGTRSKTLDEPTADERILFSVINELYDDYIEEDLGIRLVGVALGKLQKHEQDHRQLTIFDNLSQDEKDIAVNGLLKKIQKNFGEDVIMRGVNKVTEEKEQRDNVFIEGKIKNNRN